MRVDSIAPAAVLDVEGTLARLGGDKQLFVEMTTFLLEDSPQLFDDLSRAVDVNDAATVRNKAHALKGLLANGGGARASQVAQALEDAGHTNDLSRAPELIDSLDSELDTLITAIRAYRP